MDLLLEGVEPLLPGGVIHSGSLLNFFCTVCHKQTFAYAYIGVLYLSGLCQVSKYALELRLQALGYQAAPQLGRGHAGMSNGMGNRPVNLFAGGGDGSVFAPPARQVTNPAHRGF